MLEAGYLLCGDHMERLVNDLVALDLTRPMGW